MLSFILCYSENSSFCNNQNKSLILLIAGQLWITMESSLYTLNIFLHFYLHPLYHKLFWYFLYLSKQFDIVMVQHHSYHTQHLSFTLFSSLFEWNFGKFQQSCWFTYHHRSWQQQKQKQANFNRVFSIFNFQYALHLVHAVAQFSSTFSCKLCIITSCSPLDTIPTTHIHGYNAISTYLHKECKKQKCCMQNWLTCSNRFCGIPYTNL